MQVEKTGKSDWYWDMMVPDTNNYVSCGMVHHNSGKTTAGTVEMLWTALGTHPFRKTKTPTKMAVLLQDFENHAKNIFLPKVNQWCPSGELIDIEKNQTGAPRRLVFKNGSIVDIFSHDQDVKVFEGSDYHALWMDEPPPQKIFNAMWRGLTDHGGFAYVTATPIVGPWMYQEIKKAESGNDSLRWYRYVDTDENATNLGEGDAALGKKRIEEFLEMLPPSERLARKSGQFLQMQGLIFKEWKRAHHLIPEFMWPSGWPIYESIDLHSSKPWAVSWIGVTETNHKILLRSGLFEGVLDTIADQIMYERTQIDIEHNRIPNIVRCIIDNAANVPMWTRSTTGQNNKRNTVREELQNLISPPRIDVAPKDVKEKIALFQRWLNIKTDEFGKADSQFYAFNIPENEKFIDEIESYVWDTKRGGLLNGLKDVPIKINDDILDSIMQVGLSLKSGVDSPQIIKSTLGNSYRG